MTAQRVIEVLSEASAGTLLPMIRGECEGSKYHSPRPFLSRPVNLATFVAHLLEEEPGAGPDDPVLLCGTCADNLTVYLTILIAYDGGTPHSVRRDFGNQIRDLGDRAWKARTSRSFPV